MKDFTKPVGKEEVLIIHDRIDGILKAMAIVGSAMVILISKVLRIK
jgi:hypothetical protein